VRPDGREALRLALGVGLGDADEQVAPAHRGGGRVGRQHGGRNGREERAHQNAENADDDKQLDECETF